MHIPVIADITDVDIFSLYSLNSHAAFSSVSESLGLVYPCGC